MKQNAEGTKCRNNGYTWETATKVVLLQVDARGSCEQMFNIWCRLLYFFFLNKDLGKGIIYFVIFNLVSKGGFDWRSLNGSIIQQLFPPVPMELIFCITALGKLFVFISMLCPAVAFLETLHWWYKSIWPHWV